MKKLLILMAAVLSLAACSGDKTDETEKKDDKDKVVAPKTEEVAKKDDKHEHSEPDDHSECAYCSMKVYMKDEEMGAFTVKAVTDDNKTLYFDDAGCLFNYQRDNEAVVLAEKYVRDYNSLEWVTMDDAKMVHADIKTPMGYGDVFFTDTASQENFTADHSDAVETSIKAIDAVAMERYMKKKEMSGHGEGDDKDKDGNDGH